MSEADKKTSLEKSLNDLSVKVGLKVFDFNLDEVELPDEDIIHLTPEEISSNDWRVVVMAYDPSSVLTDKDRDTAKQCLQAQYQGSVHMEKLTDKFFGSGTHECVAVYYKKSEKLPSGPTFGGK